MSKKNAALRFLFYALIGGGILFVAAPVLTFGYLMFSVDPCGMDVAEVVMSPDSSKKAVLYQFDCGATTPFTSNVSILDANAPLTSSAKRVFTAHGGSQRGTWQGPLASVKWTSDVALEVTYIADATVTTQKTSERNVQLRYQLLAPRSKTIP